ncbi:DUF2975 domain-containing protein [Paenibacillus montanisoli]|uniref:DUF2975 domain-containing protein n=1 Tax=Paenibacillus montanisoli TaxID=2081970 RepID=A0A328U2Y5_9BACL|nr:DUF2975 domain-containing protein [Paenibacillus montanisoli]RAP75771.1 DUF2975 domain-containing protein [Paenibacillus montanisoli]
MEWGTALFLKVTVFLLAIPILALCVVGLPIFAKGAADLYSAYWLYPLLAIIYAAAIPYFIALFQAWKLLSYIDKNQAFTDLSVEALKKIKSCGFTISILFTAAMPFVYFIADEDDAPGAIVLGMVVMFASFVIAVFAAVLQKLLKQAIDIKSENDLTV